MRKEKTMTEDSKHLVKRIDSYAPTLAGVANFAYDRWRYHRNQLSFLRCGEDSTGNYDYHLWKVGTYASILLLITGKTDGEGWKEIIATL